MHVRIPSDHFLRRIKTDYADFQSAIIREFLQNSVDAGATRVDINIIAEGENVRLTVADDGGGCTVETITDRLLTLGGTYKEEGAVGGFGVAKELLFFAWPEWHIYTRHCHVEGTGPEYELFTHNDFTDGFRADVLLRDVSLDAFSRKCIQYVKRCSVRPDVYVNSEEIPSSLFLPSRARKILESGKLYVLPERGDGFVHVRHHGVEMFRVYSGHCENGLVLELQGKSVDLLTSNRDGFRQEAHRTEMFDFLGRLRTDKKETLRKNALIDFFTTTAMTSTLKHVESSMTGETAALDPFLSEASRSDESGTFYHKVFPLLDEDPFCLHIRGEKRTLVRAMGFLPRKRARKLARRWDMMVRKIAAVIKTDSQIVATGFVFDAEREAEWRCQDQHHYVLLNPLSLHGKYVVEEMVDRAIHEMAHVIRGASHNEEWAIEEARIRKSVRPHFKGLRSFLKREEM